MKKLLLILPTSWSNRTIDELAGLSRFLPSSLYVTTCFSHTYLEKGSLSQFDIIWVLGHAIHYEKLNQLIQKYPKSRFIVSNHDSLVAGLMSKSLFKLKHYKCEKLSQTSPDIVSNALNTEVSLCPKYVSIPSFDLKNTTKASGKVLIAGRPLITKNLYTSITAALLSSKSTSITIVSPTLPPSLLNIKEEEKNERIHLIKKKLPRPLFLDVIEQHDIVLQLTTTESLNRIGLESMLRGKPVIGCSITYLPRCWKVNPHSPRKIARKIDAILSDYEKHSKLARQLGLETARKLNQQFFAFVKRLIPDEKQYTISMI